MAVSLEPPNSGGRRGVRFRPRAEINVTPFVDVMLVLLIVFMITAPLLTVGVEVELPRTDPATMPSGGEEALAITIDAEGNIYVQETLIDQIRQREVEVAEDDEVDFDRLIATLRAMAQARETATGEDLLAERIYVRADRSVDWEGVAQVLVRLRDAGYTNFGLVTDTLVTR